MSRHRLPCINTNSSRRPSPDRDKPIPSNKSDCPRISLSAPRSCPVVQTSLHPRTRPCPLADSWRKLYPDRDRPISPNKYNRLRSEPLTPHLLPPHESPPHEAQVKTSRPASSSHSPHSLLHSPSNVNHSRLKQYAPPCLRPAQPPLPQPWTKTSHPPLAHLRPSLTAQDISQAYLHPRSPREHSEAAFSLPVPHHSAHSRDSRPHSGTVCLLRPLHLDYINFPDDLGLYR